MSGSQFVPLTLELIEEGEILKAFNAAIAHAQNQLIGHVRAWEQRAGKAKAEVSLVIKFQCESVEDDLYSITPELKVKLPGRPTKSTAAFGQEHGRDGEELAMFVRASGSTSGDPTQMHLPLDTSAADPAKPIDVGIDETPSTPKES